MTTLEEHEAVTEAIIKPMMAMYSTPYGSDQSKVALATQAYVEDLAEFSRPVLDAAWVRVRREHKTRNWPTIHIFRDACFDERSGLEPKRRKENWRDGYWDEVNERTSEYVRTFMLGDLARTAKAEDWDFQLQNYVKRVAFQQAQIVVRSERLDMPITASDKYSADDRKHWCFEDMERTGGICVSLSTEERSHMRARVESQRRAFETRGPAEKHTAIDVPASVKAREAEAAQPDDIDDLADAFGLPEPPMPDGEYAG